jgi:hypothetical protein
MGSAAARLRGRHGHDAGFAQGLDDALRGQERVGRTRSRVRCSRERRRGDAARSRGARNRNHGQLVRLHSDGTRVPYRRVLRKPRKVDRANESQLGAGLGLVPGGHSDPARRAKGVTGTRSWQSCKDLLTFGNDALH